MALNCGSSCMKYLLFIFNFLFAVSGIIIVTIGAIALGNPYAAVSGGSIHYAGPIIFIIIGVIVFLISFFGCCGAITENHCMMISFSVLMVAIFVAEVAVGVVVYQAAENLDLDASIKQYYTDPKIKDSFDVFQTDLQCCGVHGPEDWAKDGLAIPESCCAAREIKDGVLASCDAASPGLHRAGCLPKVLETLQHGRYVIAGVGVGIALVQLLGVVFACFLARSIRSQYQTV